MKVAIIGAGVSGLVTAKVLAANGHTVTIFEQRSGPGGVWERSRHYAGLKTQSPREVYVFSDFEMPRDYPEFPSAEQVLRYLESYAEKFDLYRLMKLGSRVISMRRRDDGQQGWRLELDESGAPAQSGDFDHVVLCNGLFAKPVTVDIPGRREFEASGGSLLHSVEFRSAALVAGKTVAVVGFGKSALDVAYEALRVAKQVTVVCRRTVWHLPYKIFGVVRVKYFSYARSTEFWFGRRTTGLEGFLHRRAPLLVALYWRMTELILGWHLGLLRRRFRPPHSLRDSIGLATGAAFADNLRALRNGRIGLSKGDIARLSPQGLVLDSGQIVPSEVVVLATGFEPDLALLSPDDRSKIMTSSGDYRLYRHMVNPHLPDLTFNGYNGTTAVPLTSEVGAHWIARWLDGRIARPDARTMNERIDEELAWRRARFRASDRFGHFAAPFTFGYFDAMLADMNLPPADSGRSAFARFNAMLNPKDYAFLNGR